MPQKNHILYIRWNRIVYPSHVPQPIVGEKWHIFYKMYLCTIWQEEQMQKEHHFLTIF